ESSAVSSAFAQVGIQVQNCGSSQPEPTPQPEPNIVTLSSNKPVIIDANYGNEQHYVLKNLSTDEASVYTYHGHGNVDLYVAINRPVSVNDFDCVSRNQTNDEYCGFSGIKGTDIYVLVTGADRSVDTHLVVIAEGLLPAPPEPQDLCTTLSEWSPSYYYPTGMQVQYYGHRFTAIQDNWGADPFDNYWYWNYQGSCK
ncbi:peptidase M4 family protein, partial [Vibrio anguillarum]|nr:peptidase M4 family protein [Vibrio anguillarum]